MKPTTAEILLAIAVLVGQSLAYHDDVELSVTKCQVATYAADNEECE